MTCVWLANVESAGGLFAPPPDPEIPIEYSQKPRRHPAPRAYLVSPPLSTQTSSTRPKRRRTLAEIESPNQKRQRGLYGPAHAMSQDSGPPTRKSSRRTARNAHTIIEEALEAQNLTSAVEHVLLPRQHAVDPHATPRPISGKRAPPPLLPLTDMLTGRAPVLMPRVSEEHASADAGGVEIAEVESTCESTKSTTSRQSRSPTRRMVDLQVAKKPVIPKTATSSADVPQDVRTLYKMIQALARRSKCVIPLGIEAEVMKDANGDLDDLEDYVGKTPNGKTYEELKDEFKCMRDIRDATSTCKTKHLHEPSWNELVHSQMLKRAVLGRPGFSYYNITTARVIKELVPGNEYGELLKSKMIDFAVTLGSPLIPIAHVISRLAASPHKLQRTCNPSDYSPLCFEPVVLSIETKSPDGGSENGEVQLSVWAMACFNRLRQLIQDPVAMTLPLLLITDARWKLYLASDLADEIHLIDAVDIGTTADIIGCFTILEALRVILKWVEDTYAPWFSDGVRPE